MDERRQGQKADRIRLLNLHTHCACPAQDFGGQFRRPRLFQQGKLGLEGIQCALQLPPGTFQGFQPRIPSIPPLCTQGYRLPEIAYDFAFDSKSFEKGLQAMLNAEGRMGYLDTRGREAIAFAWDKAYRFRHGLALVEKDGRMAYIDHDGAIVWQEP